MLINKAQIEIPVNVKDIKPINPESQKTLLSKEWHDTQGITEDIRYYGRWMFEEAKKKIGHLYPQVTAPEEYGFSNMTAIAWLWVRAVKCPNPACGAKMPLASKWWLSKRKSHEFWVEPVINRENMSIQFEVRSGTLTADIKRRNDLGTCATNAKGGKIKATFRCICCNTSIVKGDYIDTEADKGSLDSYPIAVVANSKQGKTYLPINVDQQTAIDTQVADFYKKEDLLAKIPLEKARGTFASNAQGRIYGFKTFSDYFTRRQLITLITLSDLIGNVLDQIILDMQKGGQPINYYYAHAIATYLSIALDKGVDYWSAICSWQANRDTMRNTFARQAISMTWDYAEANPFSNSTGNFIGAVDRIADAVSNLPCKTVGSAKLQDAMARFSNERFIISTDPPYYDNVAYADLADFFYVWLRRSLHTIYPNLFQTMLAPKAQELVANSYRFDGNKHKAQEFFESGLKQAFENMREIQHPEYPLTVYYAFKQAENDSSEGDGEEVDTMYISSTGWETMLEGLISAGFTITGTWPIRTEMENRSVGQGTNALASSIVLVCRPRPSDASSISRRQFINELRDELEEALKKMQHDGLAPVDLAQASIGPGMKVYSQYSQILESNGSPLSVRTALQLINRELDTILTAQEREYDIETRWAVAWFGEHAMEAGLYGQAETFSKAKNISLHSLVEAGLLEARAGKVPAC